MVGAALLDPFLSFNNNHLVVDGAKLGANYFFPRRASSSSRSMCLFQNTIDIPVVLVTV
jgi:hypothetical protein